MKRMLSNLSWATIDPIKLSDTHPATVKNLVNGNWYSSSSFLSFEDPLHGKEFLKVSNTSLEESKVFEENIKQTPKSGLHNPFKYPERYILYGQVCQKASSLLHSEEVFNYSVSLMQRFVPKSTAECAGELKQVRGFFENYSGDNVRFLSRGFSVPGDHQGQESNGYRWPYGPVAVISPFNFPIKLPILEMMGALFMGNKVTMKPEPKVSACVEEFIRFLHYCGMPLEDVNLLNGASEAMEHLIREDVFRMLMFTGSTRVAEKLSLLMKGRIKMEDAGFDWKILGPDVSDIDFVAYTSDEDAYAFSGEKCSAQSILFVHPNWKEEEFYDRLKIFASRRRISDLTITPILTWSNERL